jgi:DNA-binding XRE family transcriptional regulator
MYCDARLAYVDAVAAGAKTAEFPPPPANAAQAATEALIEQARSRPSDRKKTGPYTRFRQPQQEYPRRFLLIKRRKEMGLTQIELADLVKSSQKTISKLENGRRARPSLMVQRNMEKVLGMPIEDILRTE